MTNTEHNDIIRVTWDVLLHNGAAEGKNDSTKLVIFSNGESSAKNNNVFLEKFLDYFV